MTEKTSNENTEAEVGALGDEAHDLSHLSDADVEEALSEALDDDAELTQGDHEEGEGQN